MTFCLATTWATITKAERHRFPMEEQIPLPTNDKHNEEGEESDIEWLEEGEDDPMDEPEQVSGPEQEQPLWLEQYAVYNSFVTAYEERECRRFLILRH